MWDYCANCRIVFVFFPPFYTRCPICGRRGRFHGGMIPTMPQLIGRSGMPLWPPAYSYYPIEAILAAWMIRLNSFPKALLSYPIKQGTALIANSFGNIPRTITPHISGTITSSQSLETRNPFWGDLGFDIETYKRITDGPNIETSVLVSHIDNIPMGVIPFGRKSTWRHSHILKSKDHRSGLINCTTLDVDADFLSRILVKNTGVDIQSRGTIKRVKAIKGYNRSPELSDYDGTTPLATLELTGGTVDFMGSFQALDTETLQKRLKFFRQLTRKQPRDYAFTGKMKIEGVEGSLLGVDFSFSGELESDGTFIACGPPTIDINDPNGDRPITSYEPRTLELRNPKLRVGSYDVPESIPLFLFNKFKPKKVGVYMSPQQKLVVKPMYESKPSTSSSSDRVLKAFRELEGLDD